MKISQMFGVVMVVVTGLVSSGCTVVVHDHRTVRVRPYHEPHHAYRRAAPNQVYITRAPNVRGLLPQ